MNLTDILKAEHVVIVQVLRCLKKIAEECRSQGRLDTQAAREAIDFFRNYADGWHHAKEEAHLFPAMEAKGFPRDQGPTGVMIHEHEAGRERIRDMEATVDDATAGDKRAIEQFCYHARVYIEMLRQHIEKEDDCLFPMADQALDEADQQQLMAVCDRIESEDKAAGTEKKYRDLADTLAERYGVTKTQQASTSDHAGGCSS